MPVDTTPHYDVIISRDDGDEDGAYVRAGVVLREDGSCKWHAGIIGARVAIMDKQGLHQSARYQDVPRILGYGSEESDTAC